MMPPLPAVRLVPPQAAPAMPALKLAPCALLPPAPPREDSVIKIYGSLAMGFAEVHTRYPDDAAARAAFASLGVRFLGNKSLAVPDGVVIVCMKTTGAEIVYRWRR